MEIGLLYWFWYQTIRWNFKCRDYNLTSSASEKEWQTDLYMYLGKNRTRDRSVRVNKSELNSREASINSDYFDRDCKG